MDTLRYRQLTCTTGGHNKEYRVEVYEDTEAPAQHRYVVEGRYGRIGGALTRVRKYRGDDLREAVHIFENLVAEKLSKGYRSQWTNQAGFVSNTDVETMLRADGEDNLSDILPSPVQMRPQSRPRRRRTPSAQTASPAPPGPVVDYYDAAPRKITL